MPKHLAEYLQEGEVISHTCYGNTYRAVYRGGLLVDEIDPGLVFASPTSFANSHLEKGKANGWNKCKIERGGTVMWLKDLPLIKAGGGDDSGPAVVSAIKKLKLRTVADIKRALTEQPMPTAAPVVAPPKPKRATTGTKKPRTGGTTAPATPVTVPPAEPSVICAKIVEGTDGLLDVCSTQLMILDYFKYEGVLYYKEASTQELFEICADKSIGPCIGVWDSETLLIRAPYVECDDSE
jgi:hypothetical protein